MNKTYDARVAQNGRTVLPKSVREALGLTGGGTVVFSVDGDEVRLASVQKSVKHAQALYRQHAVHDRSTEDFIAERRAEAAREDLG
jgi:AbrB family looped-hinge helix DNA binding protein